MDKWTQSAAGRHTTTPVGHTSLHNEIGVDQLLFASLGEGGHHLIERTGDLTSPTSLFIIIQGLLFRIKPIMTAECETFM